MFFLFAFLGGGLRKPDFGRTIECELEVLLRVARRMTRHDANAEDLVSQTLILASKNWDRFDGRHARSWLIQIMRNEWLNMARRFKNRRETDPEAAGEPSDEGFWQAIDARLEAGVVLEALDNIPEEYRLAITLCDVEEMEYDDAASALGVPVGTLRTRLFRGRKLLRSRLVSLAPA